MPLEKLPYERTKEQNAMIMRAEVDDFFEGLKAKRHPPLEEKVDPVKAKRTLDALRKPAKSPPRSNYERITEQTYLQAQRSGTTVSAKRSKQRAKGKKLPSSANKQSNRAPRSMCLMLRGRWPVIAFLMITCLTMHFLISWRWTNTDTSTGSLSSKMKNL